LILIIHHVLNYVLVMTNLFLPLSITSLSFLVRMGGKNHQGGYSSRSALGVIVYQAQNSLADEV